MIDPEIFMAAAKAIIDVDVCYSHGKAHGCCGAIYSQSLLGTNVNYQKYFKELFKPNTLALFWWEWPHEKCKDQDARRFALILAYEIAKDEQQKRRGKK